MFTSYFANLKKVKYPVAICKYPPAWYLGAKFKQFAPKPELLLAYKNGEINEEGFAVNFKATVLDKFDPVEIYERLTRYYTENATLLCYEKPGEFCHRRLVAAWLEKANNIIILELDNSKKV